MGPIAFDTPITHSGGNVIRQMETSLEYKGEVQARNKNWRIVILPSMPFHALLSGSAEDIHSIRWKYSASIYPCEMEVDQSELRSRKHRAAQFLLDTQDLVHMTALSGALEEELGSCKLMGKPTPLSPPWHLHLTLAILPFSYKTNLGLATQFFKTKPIYKRGYIHSIRQARERLT